MFFFLFFVLEFFIFWAPLSPNCWHFYLSNIVLFTTISILLQNEVKSGGECRHTGQRSPDRCAHIVQKSNIEWMRLIGKPNSDFTLQSQMVMHGIYGKAQLNNSTNKWGAWWLWRSARQSIYPTANHGPPPCSGPPPSPMVKTALPKYDSSFSTLYSFIRSLTHLVSLHLLLCPQI